MLRSSKPYNNGPHTRRASTLYNFIDEIKTNFDISSIYIDNDKENRSFNRQVHHTSKPINKFNGKSKLSSILNQSKPLNDCKSKFIKRSALSNISNNQMQIDEEVPEKSNRKIYTKEKIDFYDELTNKHYKIKKFKEDEVTFTHSEILPEIQWQSVDNDVLTDEEQMNHANKKLMNWLGDAIKNIKKNEKYLNENIKKDFRFKYQKKY